jgi:hypothetical protein
MCFEMGPPVRREEGFDYYWSFPPLLGSDSAGAYSLSLTHSLTHSCRTVLQSQSYFRTGGLLPISSSWRQAPWDSWHSNFIFQLNTCGYSPCVTFSLMTGWVCRLQLLLVLASTVILWSESRGTHDHILLFQTRDSPSLEGQVPIFISPRTRDAWLYPQALGSLFVISYDSQGYSGDIRPRFHMGLSRKHRFQQYLYYCMLIHCQRNLFTESLPRNSSGIFAYFAFIA